MAKHIHHCVSTNRSNILQTAGVNITGQPVVMKETGIIVQTSDNAANIAQFISLLLIKYHAIPIRTNRME